MKFHDIHFLQTDPGSHETRREALPGLQPPNAAPEGLLLHAAGQPQTGQETSDQEHAGERGGGQPARPEMGTGELGVVGRRGAGERQRSWQLVAGETGGTIGPGRRRRTLQLAHLSRRCKQEGVECVVATPRGCS